jgi:hypothetical protein
MRHATYGTEFRARCFATLALMLVGIGAAMTGLVDALVH